MKRTLNKHLKIKGSHQFNVWDKVIDYNLTAYGEEIQTLKKEGLKVERISFYQTNKQGIFVITDNKGYLTLSKQT